MRERGLWERFVDWHFNQCRYSIEDHERGRIREVYANQSSADILTTPDLLKAAIIAWRETTHTWTGEKWEVKGG
jgi:hypothetical protein